MIKKINNFYSKRKIQQFLEKIINNLQNNWLEQVALHFLQKLDNSEYKV